MQDIKEKIGKYGAMKYQKIKRIHFTVPQNDTEKTWVEVTFENGTKWKPALIDIADIINKIGKCEDLKYPFGKGYKFTQEFIHRAFNKRNRKEIENLYEKEFNNSIFDEKKQKTVEEEAPLPFPT